MLDLSLFRGRTFAAAAFLRLTLGVSYYFAIFLLPLFTQDVLGWTPTESGAILVPAGIVTAVLMPVSGFLIGRIGSRPLIIAGMIAAAAGTLLFAQIDLSWDPNRLALDNILRAGAMGLFYTPLTTIALRGVHHTRTMSARPRASSIRSGRSAGASASARRRLTSRSGSPSARGGSSGQCRALTASDP